jgi:hypothetical protein
LRGDPEVIDRIIGCMFVLLGLLAADVIWEVRKWLKK